MSEATLSISGVAKSFGATVALEDACLEARAGEVHALLGENGAGKSTLLGIIAGLIRPDRGVVTLDGRPYRPQGPTEARRAGVAIVPQEPTLALHLGVAENITLGSEPTRFGMVRRDDQRRIAKGALAPLGVAIDPDAITSALSPAERQIVAIARALAHGAARVLVLDEPTSSLAAAEADRVLEATRKLAASGTCVIYVSHHLEEVTRVADRFTVMRAGRTVHVADARGATIAELAELVVGRKIEMAARSSRERGERILEVRGLSGARLPNDASFELYRGEILGIAGLVGSGRTELVRAIFGLDPVRSGQVRVGKLPSDGGATPATRLAQGVGMLSEDRRGEGVALSMSVADNLMLSRLDTVTRAGLVSSDAQDAIARRFIAELAIRASGPRAAASTLSGGNQQKVAIGRLLHHEVDVLLLDEPTRGIDPGSREQIYALAQELATAGKAILWISSQLGELLRVCDRVAVLRRGVLEPPQDAASLDEHGLLAQATGA